MRPTRRITAAITRLHDTLTNFDCVSQEDVRIAGGFRDIAEVGQVLALIRHPDLANHYGWTVPHVPRGRPQPGVARRYIVVGLHGSILDLDDSRTVRQGAMSTARLIESTTRNEANALRMVRPMMAADKKYQKWAKDTSTILDGISAQAALEADRIERLLAKPGPTFP